MAHGDMFLQLAAVTTTKTACRVFWNALQEHQHSTSSYIFIIDGVWYPELQKNIVALSPTEAKYFFSDIHCGRKPFGYIHSLPKFQTTLPPHHPFCDNQSTIAITKDDPVPCTHQTYWCATHFVLQSYQQWWHLVLYCPTANMWADISQSLWPLQGRATCILNGIVLALRGGC